jgi:transposase-like protein
MENKIYKLTDKEFIDLVKSSLNRSEVLFKLGYTTNGNSWGYSQLKQRMTDLNLSGKDFRGKSTIVDIFKKVNPEKLLCKGSKHSRNVLRKYIIREKLLPYKCAICGAVEWQGKTLSLELDHINGENNDNRIENLRFLCPNCHSQTTTYGSLNKQQTESKYEITKELTKLVIDKYLELKSIKKVYKELNIKEKVVKQIVNNAGYGKKNQKYVIQYDENNNELRRFGCIQECCQWIMDNNLVKTKLMKTCRNTLNRNIGILWHNYYFNILDA